MIYLIAPFLFAFLDRLRGTESPIYIGTQRIGFSVFYSAAVGSVAGFMTSSWIVAVCGALLFFAGEIRNWQEKGYYINGSRGIDTVAELIARGLVWYGPLLVLISMVNDVEVWHSVAWVSAASMSFWLCLPVSEWIWWRWAWNIPTGWKYFYLADVWTFSEAVRGFMFGTVFISIYLWGS